MIFKETIFQGTSLHSFDAAVLLIKARAHTMTWSLPLLNFIIIIIYKALVHTQPSITVYFKAKTEKTLALSNKGEIWAGR